MKSIIAVLDAFSTAILGGGAGVKNVRIQLYFD